MSFVNSHGCGLRKVAWLNPRLADADPDVISTFEGDTTCSICGLRAKRYGEDVVVGTMADGESACRSRIVPCSSGDGKDIGAAEWW